MGRRIFVFYSNFYAERIFSGRMESDSESGGGADRTAGRVRLPGVSGYCIRNGAAAPCFSCSLLAGKSSGFSGGYLIRRGNRILLGTFLALHVLIPVFLGIAAALPFVLLGSFGLLMIWIRGHGEKNFAEAKGKVPFLSGVWLGAAALLLFGIFQIFFPFWNYEKAGWASYLEENIKEGLDQIRYGGAGENMPGGDLRNVEAFSWTGEPVLEVTMSRPDSYYLRGYVGGRFDGSRWERRRMRNSGRREISFTG